MGTGKASKEGFNVQSAGFVFEPLRAPFWTEKCINLFDKITEKWYLVMERRTPTDGLIPWTSLLSKLQHTCKAGMMVNTNLGIQGRALGVLVEILEENAEASDILRVRVLTTTNVVLMPDIKWVERGRSNSRRMQMIRWVVAMGP